MSKRIKETSTESLKRINENLNDRYNMCLNGLKELDQATANELAMHLFKQGILPYFTRNFVHPRLTELVDMNKIKVIGKKIDDITNKKCMIYTLA